MEKYIDREIVNTRCPNCESEIDSVWVCKLESATVLRYAYFCTICQKNLGVFSRKGFPPASAFNSHIKSANSSNM